MEVLTRIYLVKDSFGKKVYASCEDCSDTIQISGLQNKDGKPVYFESEAYHLSTFCWEHKLELKVIRHTYDFDDLWNKHTD